MSVPAGADTATERGAGDRAIVKPDDINGAGIRIGLQRHEQPPLVDRRRLAPCCRWRRAASRQFQRRGAIQPFHVILTHHERIDRRRPGDVHVIVAEVDAHRRAGRGHQLVEPEAVAIAPVERDRVRSVVDDGEDLAAILLDASRVAADAAFAVGRQRLQQGAVPTS